VVVVGGPSTAVWDEGSSVVETLGGAVTWGADLNDRGQAVGSSSVADRPTTRSAGTTA
jgi:hypothetical protein